MSASFPESSDRESEALKRAQRAHEPSMEEILASIRAIIADDRDGEAVKAAPRSAVNTGPQIVYSNDSPSPARAAPVEVEPQANIPSIAPLAPNVIWARPNIEFAAPQAVVTLAPDPEPLAEPEAVETRAAEAPLLSEEADRAVSASFQALSATLQQQSAELVESLTREMLRPMIKTWLDENLPSLVERLVRAEIQRVARGGR